MEGSIKTKIVAAYSQMTGELYDLIYSTKDYKGESDKLKQIIAEKCQSGGQRLLEVACGTGTYMKLLEDDFSVEGLDLSPEQVAAARQKLPGVRIEQADMLDFNMNALYDVVICLFSSIGYAQTEDNLNKVVANMARHTKPGGLVIIEPWLREENVVENKLSFDTARSNGHLSVARMGLLSREGKLTTLHLHHMVRTKKEISHFLEEHTLTMFSDEDFRSAFSLASLSFEYDPVGLDGRGLYIGQKQL